MNRSLVALAIKAAKLKYGWWQGKHYSTRIFRKCGCKKEERIGYSYYKYTDTGFEKSILKYKNHEGDLVIFCGLVFFLHFSKDLL